MEFRDSLDDVMWNLVLIDKVRKVQKYVNLKKEDDKIVVSGYVRKKNRKGVLEKNIFDEFVNLIKLKDYSKFIGEVDEYKLYEDEYGYVHFVKNSLEDYVKFLVFNGKSEILAFYRNRDKNSIKDFLNKVNNYLKKADLLLEIELGVITVIFSITICNIFLNRSIDEDDLVSYPAIQQAILEENDREFVECSTVLDAIEIINSLDLTEEEKKVFSDRDLLEVVFDYSNGEIGDKIGWGIGIVDCNVGNSPMSENTGGFYTKVTPYTIYIEDSLDDNSRYGILKHEYDHYLQSYNCPIFLAEMRASEVASLDYSDREVAYSIGNLNYMLIKCIVSEEALMDYIYGVDAESGKLFKEEFCKYIS